LPEINSWTIQASADTSHHPNKIPFEGILTVVDVVSDKAPSGSRGHRVVLTKEAAEGALNSLIGQAVDYKVGWDGHDARQKVGVITSAWFDDNKLMVAGFLYAKDFPEVVEKLDNTKGNPMGMSYEMHNAHISDMNRSIWELNHCTFTGAAILYREKAAYKGTSFNLVKPEKGSRAA